MAANPKIVDPHLDWGEQVKSIRLEVDQDRARALGLTPQDVAQTLQTLLSGFTVTQYREGIEHIDVVARAVPAERLELDRLPALTIATRNGVAVPLSQIARLHYEYEEPILWRRNRDIVLTARADIVDGVQAPDVTNEVLAEARSRSRTRLPYGYRIETGGSIEESAKANGALVAVFPVMAVVMLALLMIQLQSFSRLALVFVTAPLGHDRRHRGAAALQPAVRVRGAARPDRACRHDHAQHRHPGRSDRPRHRRRPRPVSRHHRRHRAARAAGGADRAGRDPRHDPAGPQHLLGPDGDHDHGRPVRRDRADAAGRAGALCAVVPGARRRVLRYVPSNVRD